MGAAEWIQKCTETVCLPKHIANTTKVFIRGKSGRFQGWSSQSPKWISFSPPGEYTEGDVWYHITSCSAQADVKTKNFYAKNSVILFRIQSKFCQCTRKTKELALPFQDFSKGLQRLLPPHLHNKQCCERRDVDDEENRRWQIGPQGKEWLILCR